MNEHLDDMLCRILKIEKSDISDELMLENVNVWDSLTHMDLVVSIESMYGIELTINEIVAMKTIKAIKCILKNKGLEV